MREHPNKSFGLRKRDSEKRQAKTFRRRREMAGNRQHTQGISHLGSGKKLRSQLHLAGALTPESGKILCEANDVVILELSQRSRRWMRRQVFLRGEYAERNGCHPLSNQLTFAWITHSDDEVEVTRR